ncbi:MAG: hypothetical protein LW832_06170, partial [Parachlamydia sp.]|nr:hypothetical protein [Parachlamydia sp.]
VRCNRGYDCGTQPGILIYQIDRQCVTREILENLACRQKITAAQSVRIETLASKLGGKFLHYQPMDVQTAGNCTYTSMQAALFFLMAYSQFRKQESGVSLEKAFEAVKPSYQKWVEFDLQKVNEDFIEETKFIRGQVSPDLGSTYSQALTTLRFKNMFR